MQGNSVEKDKFISLFNANLEEYKAKDQLTYYKLLEELIFAQITQKKLEKVETLDEMLHFKI